MTVASRANRVRVALEAHWLSQVFYWWCFIDCIWCFSNMMFV